MEQRQFSLRALLIVVTVAGLLFGMVRAVPLLLFVLAFSLAFVLFLALAILGGFAVSWIGGIVVGAAVKPFGRSNRNIARQTQVVVERTDTPVASVVAVGTNSLEPRQFSLRALMIAVTAVAALCGIVRLLPAMGFLLVLMLTYFLVVVPLVTFAILVATTLIAVGETAAGLFVRITRRTRVKARGLATSPPRFDPLDFTI